LKLPPDAIDGPQPLGQITRNRKDLAADGFDFHNTILGCGADAVQ